MKINLYYDVLLVPPAILVEKGEEHAYVERFVKRISMPFLLVPGQTYHVEYDPADNNPFGVGCEITDSGVFEDGSKQIPHMVVKNDYWLAFDEWLEHEVGQEERELPFDEQVALWRQQDKAELELVKRRFKSCGWEICSSEEREPYRSRPTLIKY